MKEIPMCEAPFKVPEDYVPTDEQAHALGLLTTLETMKLLDLGIAEFADEVNRGRIEVAARCNNTPCFSLQAIDAYKRIRHSQAS
jgi:hypothetical protein